LQKLLGEDLSGSGYTRVHEIVSGPDSRLNIIARRMGSYWQQAFWERVASVDSVRILYRVVFAAEKMSGKKADLNQLGLVRKSGIGSATVAGRWKLQENTNTIAYIDPPSDLLKKIAGFS